MADNLPSITVPAGQWIDLYSLTGIDVSARIVVQNIGSSDIYITSSLWMPELDNDSYQVIHPNNIPMINGIQDKKAWAFSPNQNGKVSVRESI